MAITCKWEVVKGYIVQKESNLLVMYGGGNCTACICHDIKDKDGYTIHNLADFICDKEHLKRILSDESNHWRTYYQEVYLNGKYPDNWQIGKLISKQDIRVIYYTDNTCPFNQ